MGLFGKKKKSSPAPAEPKLVMESSFVRSGSFRGFKRFRLTVHGITDAEQNAEKLKDADLKNAEISFKVFLDEHKTEFANVYINGLRVGIIWDEEEIQSIKKKAFDKVYVMFEDETVIGKDETIVRPRVRLFVRYATEGKQL